MGLVAHLALAVVLGLAIVLASWVLVYWLDGASRLPVWGFQTVGITILVISATLIGLGLISLFSEGG